MRLPSTRTLVKTAIIGGIVCISSVMYVRSRIETRVRDSEHFRAAMATLRTNAGAVHLLGEPIREKGFDLGDTRRNYCDSNRAQFEVKVRGTKDKGTMYFWAEREAADVGVDASKVDAGAEAGPKSLVWRVKRLELEVSSVPDRRLVVVKRPTTDGNNNVVAAA